MDATQILTWISIISGGLLILMMAIALIAGMEWEVDVSDGDLDSGGLGVIKGGLTFLSVCSWVVKLILETDTPLYLAILSGVSAGIVSVLILSWIFKLLLKNQVNVNWNPDDAIGQIGKVYLKVPKIGSGIITVKIKGTKRELKAKTKDPQDIPTGSKIFINDYENGFAEVSILK
jgi:hypothetical protein